MQRLKEMLKKTLLAERLLMCAVVGEGRECWGLCQYKCAKRAFNVQWVVFQPKV